MNFRIADTFTDSLTKLTGQEQKAVKTTAFDLQLDPTNPGMKFHKLGRAKDPNFWFVRVNRDVRLIVHKTASSLLLCYVDHHDDAYAWAERRRIERHAYRDVARLGRKTRIGGKQREALWSIFEQVRAELARRELVTWPDVFGRVAEHLEGSGDRPFEFAVVDEAQDLGVAISATRWVFRMPGRCSIASATPSRMPAGIAAWT